MKGKRYATEGKIRIMRAVIVGKKHPGPLPGRERIGSDVSPVEAAVWSPGGERGPAAR